MTEILVMFFATLGSIVILIAAIGIFRMPDFYLRLSVTIKAATLGTGFILVAASIFFGEPSINMKSFAIALFLILTAPVSGHLIARAAYYSGTKLWKETVIDEMKGMYDKEKGILKSGEEEED
ncbi:multisubunit sodium/proton antiporter, MrpG subunit [Pseudopedobacter saltans DSM 12145]|uniref:Multisubunit sodium/proton antiporter, MrpG subunit n=1 Tax=Pseudopedobacter saltans (strain ATCC 51119 / DSM 12145 / JCM 21818 / CCUG 39354 / LMG 10337 / NBRC 100064 / NCIMB 13643) TaxID=762903 RepID=F0SE82_PSESL|nr:monovalent cation/H(+) antiporter subunit G [Pseudopedobacter saltans]ADY54004.1 multisubunit sodium/proton antiporter, MrpG subunit [Pseudopedobacter saltans DSM 12145]